MAAASTTVSVESPPEPWVVVVPAVVSWLVFRVLLVVTVLEVPALVVVLLLVLVAVLVVVPALVVVVVAEGDQLKVVFAEITPP